MLSLFLFLIIIIFKADAQGPDNDPVEITFKIKNERAAYITCDIDNDNQEYTVVEGGELLITAKYNSLINHLICSYYFNYNDSYIYSEIDCLKNGNTATIKIKKIMGTLWNCTVLVHRNNPTALPVIQYNNEMYSAAYCFMKVHVRQKKTPQKIFVNHMVMQAGRTDLSEKDVDFTAEYQYADGDVVDVTCVNFLPTAQLTMEYAMAGIMSHNSTISDLSYRKIGFVAKLLSGHNNSYMICTNTEPTDYTKVMVRFVMRTEFNLIRVMINGMTLQPTLKNDLSRQYEIEYIYWSFYTLTKVVCEVLRTDMNLVVVDKPDFVGEAKGYIKTDLVPTKKAEMSFHLEHTLDGKKLLCTSDDINATRVEQVAIRFILDDLFHKEQNEQFPMHMELPSNGTVMKLYSDNTLKDIFYEFEDGETLQLKCGPLIVRNGPGPIRYLQLKDSNVCKSEGCAVAKTLHLTRNDEKTEVVCYLKELIDPFDPSKDRVVREIRVILRERVLTTTSPVTALSTVITTTNTPGDPASSERHTNSYTLVHCLTTAGVSVIIVLAILYWTVKKPCCCLQPTSLELRPEPMPRPHPDTVYYQNLLSIFQPINEREAAELENHYEEI